MITSERIRDSDEEASASSKTDEKSFAEQVDDVLAGRFPIYSSLKVCDTPQILLDVGCKQLPMLYTQKHLKDAVKPKDGHNSHFHGLSVECLKCIPEYLSKPAMLLDSVSPNKNGNKSIIAVLNLIDNDNAPIIVSIIPNGKGLHQLEMIDANFITSIYGKDNGFIRFVEKTVECGNVLYWDKERSQELFMFQRLQLPKAFNNLDSNVIIHQSRNIVNTNCGKTENTFSANQSSPERKLEELVEWSQDVIEACEEHAQQREAEKNRGQAR